MSLKWGSPDLKELSPQQEAARRESHLKRTYGITESQYNELLLKQDGRCAICRKEQQEFVRRLAVDHDHISGVIRGLLCNFCNHRVIGRHRDAELLHRMADYVTWNSGWTVPEKKKKARKPRKARVRNG